MSDRDWSRLRSLFDEVQPMTDAERQAYLDSELSGEPELLAELRALLASDAASGSFLRQPDSKTRSSGASPGAGSTVGNYRLLEGLGKGGFGIVYLAEQQRPIRRRVALKLVKPGMDTKQVIARFEAERQALALMDHPGIAQVFEAGETEEGRPYFAMEYVPGIPITAFCDEERLRVRDRLDLFLKVCDAVQHAHQKGVIHRDLKPSNVLVARRDGETILKVIDFGIVKATSGGADDQSFLTREGMVLGTLGYMSPEQAGAIEAEIDTRSDIYSMGVLLYELLSGGPPFDKTRLRRIAWSEAVRVIREEDPPSMTARLSRGGAPGEAISAGREMHVAEIARRRSTDESELLRDLRGDLEWIVMRALEKDPARRYASASELSADVRRYLANEAVLARAPTTIYRVRKFARRHRVGVVAAALVLASIVAGGVAAGIGFTRARLAERSARREAASARQVVDFLVDLFDASTPDRSLGETITARTLLDLGARRIEGDAIEDPLVRARLLSTLAAAHEKLGLFDEAIALQQNAIEATRSALPEESPELGRELRRLAESMRGAGKLGGIDSVIDRSVEILSRGAGSDAIELAQALHVKSASLLALGGPNLAPADSLIRIAIHAVETAPRPDTAALVSFYTTKAFIDGNSGDQQAQEADLLRALELARLSKGERHSRVVVIHRSLAQCYTQLRRPEAARRHADEALRVARIIFPPGHPSLALALSTQGEALFAEGKLAEAAAASEEALAMLRAGYGRDHPSQAWELFTLGTIYRDLRRLDLAIERFREAAEMRSRLHGSTSSRAAEVLTTLASTLAEAGETERADSAFRAAIPNLEQAIKTRPHGVGASYLEYANFCRDVWRLAEADTFYTRAESLLGGIPVFLGGCLTEHAYLRSMQGRHAEADSIMRAGIAVCEEAEEDDSPYLAAAYVLWAATRARAGNADGAIEALGRAVNGGVTAKQVARYRELGPLASRADYPEALR